MARSILVPSAAAGVYHYRRLVGGGLPDPPSPSADNSRLGAADVLSMAATGALVLLLVAWVAFGCYLERRSSSRNSNGHGDGGGRAAADVELPRQAPPAALVCTYRAAEDGQEEEQACSVCLSELADGEAVRVLTGCRHCFHAACIDKWLRERRTCPNCRAPAAVAAANTAAKGGRN
ncbi:hypothetical protein BS78_K266900 [Paspalum vaginatum]|uniref:RING-type domain-containing protein n=1 Tax=Paspalum vaginatum TaxID=158149 RepID=A0A9W7XB29_9POAL|nr:hypothetical protein BS78_K266900 [Paspalum vaginatum]